MRNLGAGGYSDIALRDTINEGQLPGPRIDASGPPLGITGGHCDNNLLPFEYHHKQTAWLTAWRSASQSARDYQVWR